jgi:DNA-binding IclR family transcriptional regulator
LLAAISVSAPEARLPDSVRTALVPQLQRVAEEFGRSLLQAEETA